MKKEGTFSIRYDGREIAVPKSEAVFVNGYAVISRTIKDSASNGRGFWYNYDLYLLGVIDQNYDTVFNFQGWNKEIQIFKEGNIIVTVKYSDDEGVYRFENHHYKIENKKPKLVRKFHAWSYDVINETTIKISNNVFESGYEAFYDVVKGEFISKKFTKIFPFESISPDSEEKLAKAIYRIKVDKNEVYDVVCYIDEKGIIRTNLYNPVDGSLIDTTKEGFDFDSEVKKIEEQVRVLSNSREEGSKSLLKQVNPKKD